VPLAAKLLSNASRSRLDLCEATGRDVAAGRGFPGLAAGEIVGVGAVGVTRLAGAGVGIVGAGLRAEGVRGCAGKTGACCARAGGGGLGGSANGVGVGTALCAAGG